MPPRGSVKVGGMMHTKCLQLCLACLKHTMTAGEYFPHMEQESSSDSHPRIFLVRELPEPRSISCDGRQNTRPACNPTVRTAGKGSGSLAADMTSNAQ